MELTRRARRVALIVVAGAALVPALATLASAANGSPPASAAVGSRVVLLGGLDVPTGKTVQNVVVVKGPVTIDGTVTGSLLSVDGRVSISGHVEGDVVAVNGPVELLDGAEVDGDVSSRLTPTIAPGATLKGSVHGINVDFHAANLFVARFVFWVATSISILILGLLLLAFAPRAAQAAFDTMRDATGASIGVGFAVFFGFPVVAVLALATIVGIPLGLGIMLALLPVYTLGYLTAVWLLGRRIVGPPTSPFLAFLVGWVILRALALVPVLGGLLWFLGAVFGLGVLAVAARRAGRRASVGPEVAPIPPAPA